VGVDRRRRDRHARFHDPRAPQRLPLARGAARRLPALGLYALGARGEALVLVPVLVDVPVFWLLFRFLRARFEDARRERVFALGQR
jgi:hypothetical protein